MPAESSPTHTIANASTTKGAVRAPIARVTQAATGPETAPPSVAAGSDGLAGTGKRNHASVAAAAISAMTGSPCSNVSKLECVAVIRWTYIVQIAYGSTNRGTIRSGTSFNASRMSSPPLHRRACTRDGRRLPSTSLTYAEIHVVGREVGVVEGIAVEKARMLAEHDRPLPVSPRHPRAVERVLATTQGFVMDQLDPRADDLVEAVLDQAEAQRDIVVGHGKVFVEAAHGVELLPLDHEARARHRNPVVLEHVAGALAGRVGPIGGRFRLVLALLGGVGLAV